MSASTVATPPVAAARPPAAFPLALGACLLAISLLTAVVVGALTPTTGMTAVQTVGQWLGWFCGVGLLVAINVALATSLVARRGSPRRFALALVAAALVFYAGSFALSLARGWALQAWVAAHPDSTRLAMAWLPFVSVLQMLLVAALGLLLAWRLGGRGPLPQGWSIRARRAFGVVVGFAACIGLLPLQGRLLAMLDVVSLDLLQNGLPFLAVTLGAVHGLAWGVAPARHGSGAWPAFWSAALVGPLLLGIAWGSPFLLRHAGSTGVSMFAGALLLACPLLAWVLVRATSARLRRAQPG
ncbi:hypothetical protein ACFQZQ_10295 [Lysobacter koreensis]|uniref:Uncharacterized protein n=1 Tax=Lysobacter koreensis TaxID=266122 RepID=A0ABW2YMS5_9GAMM